MTSNAARALRRAPAPPGSRSRCDRALPGWRRGPRPGWPRESARVELAPRLVVVRPGRVADSPTRAIAQPGSCPAAPPEAAHRLLVAEGIAPHQPPVEPALRLGRRGSKRGSKRRGRRSRDRSRSGRRCSSSRLPLPLLRRDERTRHHTAGQGDHEPPARRHQGDFMLIDSWPFPGLSEPPMIPLRPVRLPSDPAPNGAAETLDRLKALLGEMFQLDRGARLQPVPDHDLKTAETPRVPRPATPLPGALT